MSFLALSFVNKNWKLALKSKTYEITDCFTLRLVRFVHFWSKQSLLRKFAAG
jgi:hypothetical protein